MEELIVGLDKTKNELAKTINDARLPATVLIPIVSGLLEQLMAQEQQQLVLAKKEIEKKNKKKGEKTKNGRL